MMNEGQDVCPGDVSGLPNLWGHSGLDGNPFLHRGFPEQEIIGVYVIGGLDDAGPFDNCNHYNEQTLGTHPGLFPRMPYRDILCYADF